MSVSAIVPQKSQMAYFHVQSAFVGFPGLFSPFSPTNLGSPSNLILSPALKRWEPPGRQGLGRHAAHLWATSDSLPRREALGTPKTAGVTSHPAHLWAKPNSLPPL